ncbi:hypothetical protein [Streptomyces sp. NBC_01294]|uniref:hypothetical protein n=1 Tax=Streptomyces sp. NBC_01294 TaxID=2903815 RepID=UPI002DDC6683|nr:hypothetical protein [Streptomyces sp. NBC_01294]WRZ55855.1 hypothetical protein OG534_04805 [Streptomyces sp. NBC_01294]
MSAAFGAVCVVLWGLDATRFAGLYVVIGGAVAAPLFCTRRAQAFVPACLIAGCTLLACGVLFFLLGVFLFWPSALLLLLASFADPRRHPVAGRISGGLGALVTAGVLAGSLAYGWHVHLGPALATPHTFRAATDPGWFRNGLGDTDERLRRFGATSVTGSESDEGSYLEVRFTDGLSHTQRAELKREIAQLPGVRGVELCPVRDCG